MIMATCKNKGKMLKCVTCFYNGLIRTTENSLETIEQAFKQYCTMIKLKKVVEVLKNENTA